MSKEQGTISKRNTSSSTGPSSDKLEAKRRAVEVGIADADAGRLIPFDQIKAWMLSWGTRNELPRPKPGSKPRS